MDEPLIAALQANTDALKHHLQVFDDTALNKRINPVSWTAGEVGEHLLMFDQRVNKILPGETRSPDRDPQAKIALFTRRLADRDNRIDAPAFLAPSGIQTSSASLIGEIEKERAILTKLIREKDMTLLYPAAPHRFFGPMTGMEWVQFLILHGERHFLQLDEISKTLQ
ncbi:MAG TPA: DinB family protein [Sediminibacterium sp.]|nr:DinB family protein [Sediminibacterium sp.]